MNDFDRQQIAARAQEVSVHWPTLTEALGCLDCNLLFRLAVDGCCPLCGSRSVMNVAEFFNEARLKEKRDAELTGDGQDTSISPPAASGPDSPTSNTGGSV